MLKRFLIYIFSLLFLSTCGDDLNMPEHNGFDSNGCVDLTFSIPEVKTVATRSEDDEVKKITALVFDGNQESSQLLQIKDFTASEITDLSSGRYKVNLQLDKAIVGNKTLYFYFIANPPSSIIFTKNMSLSDVKIICTDEISNTDGYVMSGKASLSECISSDIPLIRNAAKITVTDRKETTEGQYEPGNNKYNFAIFGDATESSILAGTTPTLSAPSNSYIFPNDITESNERLSHPTLNTGENEAASFIIVKAQYQNKNYFYRLDFKIKEKDSNGKDIEKYLDIESNHWYQVFILSVDGIGYDSPKEAAKHPVSLISYDIHDHSPVVFNMITDGLRELGVSHEVNYSGEPTQGNPYPCFYIKVYSPVDSEQTIKKEDISIPEDWLEIVEDIVDVTEFNENNSPIAGSDAVAGSDKESCTNNKGKIFKVSLNFKETSNLGSLESKITVNWKGLSRVIPVIWTREFMGSDLCDVKLTIHKADGSEFSQVDNYWGFLNNSTSSNNNGKLYGIAPDNNNGKIRNEGLHFPIMYGDRNTGNDKRWYYSYDVTLNVFEGKSFEYSFELAGDNAIKNHVTINGNSVSSSRFSSDSGSKPNFTVSRPGNAYPNATLEDDSQNDYEYGIGKLIIHVYPKEGDTNTIEKETSFSINLYHTGFFHYDNQYGMSQSNGVKDSKYIKVNQNNYLYYEVVPIRGASRMRYWLDRNLGATSAGQYIQDSNGNTYHGDPNAAGGYYKVASYSQYNDPVMYDSGSNRVSPPGYRVPKQTVWDAMRNSSNFKLYDAGSYFTSYYDTGNPEIGKVYFPKARYMEGNVSKGESRTGYYWTQTAATGTEKEEIGNWLKVLSISGTSSSYIFGQVGRGSESGYSMSVRCINDIPDNRQKLRTHFNVSGATHVYLYQLKNGVRTATTTWPGHAIGNYSTMTEGKWFNFSFESDVFNPDDLYVIFNFIDENGIIKTMCQESIGKDLQTQTSINPQSATGWKIKDITVDDLKDPNYPNISGSTALGYWWKAFTSTSKNKVYCYSVNTSSKRVYFKNNSNWSQPHIHMWKNGGSQTTTWPGVEMNHLNENYWYYDVPITYDRIQFNDGNEVKTENLTIHENMLYNWWTDYNAKNDDSHWIKWPE